jgi:serine O-acetyltransferase
VLNEAHATPQNGDGDGDSVGDARAPRPFTDPGAWTLAVRTFGRWAARQQSRPLRWAGSKVYGGLLLFVQVTTGNIIYREVKVGANLDVRGSRNVLIHPGVEIGDGCRIGSFVTLGTNARFKAGAPKVGNGVVIETGAKILGPVTIGDGAVIRANSLVLGNVPAGAVALGVPARATRPGEPAPRPR